MTANTVYISYLPSHSMYIAQLLFNELDALGVNVFMDIDEGVDPVSLRQVAARQHFIMILTPGVLGNAGAPDDRLTLDFQQAVQHKRNMVLLLSKDFFFGDELLVEDGLMANLPRIKQIRVNPNHMSAIVNVLARDFFNQQAQAPSVPTPPPDAPAVQQKIADARGYARQATIRLNTEKLLFRAVTKIRRGQFADALQDLDMVIANSPKNENAYLQRAMLQQQMGRLTAALRDYEKAVQISPKMVLAHVGRGQLLLLMGRSQQSLAAFQMGLKVEADSAAALAGAALANHNLGNANEARRQWHLLVERDANYSDLAWAQKQFRWDDEMLEHARNLMKQL